MTFEHALSIVGIIVPFVMALAAALWHTAQRLAELETKVAAMWEFQLRRAQNELLSKGYGIMNSPLRVFDSAKALLAPLAGELQYFYQRLGRRMTDAELALEIERLFGERLAKDVCLPHGLQEGACLLIAIAVAREEEIVTPTTPPRGFASRRRFGNGNVIRLKPEDHDD